MRRLLSLGVAGAIAMSWGDAPAVPVLAAQVQADGRSASIATLLSEIERVMLRGDPAAYLDLLHQSANRNSADAFSIDQIRRAATRAVIRERARQPFDAGNPLAGQRLMVDAFAEFGNRARVATWQIDVRPSETGEWQIVSQESLTAIDDIYRLSLDTSKRFRVRDFTVSAQDLELTLTDGHVYFVTSDDRVAGLLLLGSGEMRFSPASATERRQVEIVAGAETLRSAFNSAYIRAANIDEHIDRTRLEVVPIDRTELRKVQESSRPNRQRPTCWAWAI